MSTLLDRLAPRFNKRQAEILAKLDEARDALATLDVANLIAYVEETVKPEDDEITAERKCANNADAFEQNLSMMATQADRLSFAAILLSECKPTSADAIPAP